MKADSYALDQEPSPEFRRKYRVLVEECYRLDVAIETATAMGDVVVWRELMQENEAQLQRLRQLKLELIAEVTVPKDTQ